MDRKGNNKSLNRLLPKDVGSSMRVSTVLYHIEYEAFQLTRDFSSSSKAVFRGLLEGAS